MKTTKILVVTAFCALVMSCQTGEFKGVKTLENEVDSVSYAVGLNLANSMRANFKEINEDAFMQAVKDGLDSANFKLDPTKAQQVMRPYFQKKQQEQAKEREAKAISTAETQFADNKKAGEDFLAKNKSEKGVITTPTGLQYKVLKEGKGEFVKPTDKIKIHYHGTTIDGKVFDSTVEKNKPYETTANIFVPGFNEGLTKMKKGSKHMFYIPQELAYQYRQRGPNIPPFSTLIFEVEVLEINAK